MVCARFLSFLASFKGFNYLYKCSFASRTVKTRIILDTNFLLIPAQFKVDIFLELRRLMTVPYDVCIFKATIDELQKITSKNTRDKVSANIALKLIKQQNLKTLPNSTSTEGIYIDEIILQGITDRDIVCTQDAALKRALKAKFPNIRLIVLKSKQYLAFA